MYVQVSLLADDLEERVERLDRMAPPCSAVPGMGEVGEELGHLLYRLDRIFIASRYFTNLIK